MIVSWSQEEILLVEQKDVLNRESMRVQDKGPVPTFPSTRHLRDQSAVWDTRSLFESPPVGDSEPPK